MSRFSLDAIRRYEGAIALIVKNFPKATTFTPIGSCETFAARLRDAMRALSLRGPTAPSVNYARFLEVHPNITVRITHDHRVIAGGKVETKIAVDGQPHVTSTTQSVLSLRAEQCSPIVIEALLVCKANGLITQPVKLATVPPTETVEAWQNRFDFELIPDEIGAILI